MYFSTPLVAILSLASATVALAAPQPKSTYTEGQGLPTGDIADYPAWECKHHYDGLYDTFVLFGRNWKSNEKEIKGVCKKGGTLTDWNYDEPEGPEDVFSASFLSKVKSTRRLEKKLDKFLGIKHGGVRCPKVPMSEFHFDHWDFHFNGNERDDLQN